MEMTPLFLCGPGRNDGAETDDRRDPFQLESAIGLDSVVYSRVYDLPWSRHMATLTIGQVAKEAGIGVETVRFYEREGLLERPDRRPSGYRLFDAEAVRRLRFIKQAQRLGFTLREIRELLALKIDPQTTRAQVRQHAELKLADINQRIRDLQRMKRALVPLIQACDGQGQLEGCPILSAIEPPCHSPQASTTD